MDVASTISNIIQISSGREPNARLLRIYWYDGISQEKGMSTDHITLSQQPNVKLRFGFLNSHGQQKGVDSLIVTDLIDLARNKAISDAVILSGDEDIRVGVQIAQTFGVRVHLLGIKPSRGNQSQQLIHECDTHHVLEEDKIKNCIKIKLRSESNRVVNTMAEKVAPKGQQSNVFDACARAAEIVSNMETNERKNVKSHFDMKGSFPHEFDAPMLAGTRDAINRDLTQEEKRHLRSEIQKLLL
jgi:uncharacterized LabA/DUF88 family protein